MPEPLEHAIIESTQRVIETATFLTVWPWSEEDGELPLPDTIATMTFRGPLCGQLTLRVNSSLLPTLVENMLGGSEEEGAEEDKRRDALCEVLNMICGNLLPLWQGEDAVFDLSPPSVEFEPHPPAATPQAVVPFCLEGTRAEVELSLDEAAVTADVENSGAQR